MTHDQMRSRAAALGLHGLVARWDELADAPWVTALLEGEEAERKRRSLERRLKNARIGACRPQLLVIDEVGYLSYDNRHADLLFEVVSRRYRQRSIVVSTNRIFAEWNEVFPSAACVVALVDRLVHDAEIIPIEGNSYRAKEAGEKASKRAVARRKPKT
ncbi:MAG: ATP-binding protein [Pseudomonadota bacterium]|nr:ATP-binding protein [Pseudomonadota bacterium]